MTVSNIVKVAAFAAIAFATAGLGSAQKGQGADGNPHGWDRMRRCDHAGYTPKCGLCEGYGGIPYGEEGCSGHGIGLDSQLTKPPLLSFLRLAGDDNDQITLTTCAPVANASDVDPKTLKRPIWSV